MLNDKKIIILVAISVTFTNSFTYPFKILSQNILEMLARMPTKANNSKDAIVMKLQTTTRHLNTDELKILNSLLAKAKKESKSKIKFSHFVFAGLLGISLAYITSIIPDNFWTFLFGTSAVLFFAFIVFIPYEIYKDNKQKKVYLETLQNYIDKQTVEICKINGFRIAIAPEFEDESDLYIVELEKNKVLYLWDTEYNLKKNSLVWTLKCTKTNFSN